MTLKETCVSDLRQEEGLRLKPYKDTEGVLTIGYGRNLEHKGISTAEAAVLLENDVDETIAALETMDFWPLVNDARRSVLVNMAFNLGVHGLLGFSLMLDAVRRGDYDVAARQMLNSKWAAQVGTRAVTLSQRMRNGV